MLRAHILHEHHTRFLRPLQEGRFRPGRRRYGQGQSQDPLRILFCGADDFSIYSLRAVHELQNRKPDSIASIDVVCRPGKRVGRGLKRIQEVPIKSAAEDLRIPVHQIDTFTGWSPPSPVDLVVAVSFGLLVPSRILRSTTHGGLNVHPSLLPDFRGPAPIQHALLRARQFTGVSLQTMHPTRFDHGTILDQTPAPGVPIAPDASMAELVNSLGLLGAEMLSRGIDGRVWLDHASRASPVASNAAAPVSHAPKIMPEDRHIDWDTWTADRIIRYDRVIGRLWDSVSYGRCQTLATTQVKRVTFHGPWHKVSSDHICESRSDDGRPGDPVHAILSGSQSPVLAFSTCDGCFVKPGAATIEGEQKHRGTETLSRALTAR